MSVSKECLGRCVCAGGAGRVRAPQRLACDVDALVIENKGNKNPIRVQCLHRPGLVGDELCPNLHILAQKAWANTSEAKLGS